MDLRTASLLCEHFIACTKPDGLCDQLSYVLEQGEDIKARSAGNSYLSQDASENLQAVITKVINLYQVSVFCDPGMKVFPEYRQLGLSNAVISDCFESLQALSTEIIPSDELDRHLERLSQAYTLIMELSDQISKLMALAEYFGIEAREQFSSEAIAMIQMPQGESGENASGNVDVFVERLQAFQSLVEFFGVHDPAIGSNIRIIADNDALVLADLSETGATWLQNIISDVKAARSQASELAAIMQRLEGLMVNSDIIDMLAKEINGLRKLDKSKVGSHLAALFDTQNGTAAERMAHIVMDFLNSNIRIESVVLKASGRARDGSYPRSKMAKANNESDNVSAVPTDDNLSPVFDDQNAIQEGFMVGVSKETMSLTAPQASTPGPTQYASAPHVPEEDILPTGDKNSAHEQATELIGSKQDAMPHHAVSELRGVIDPGRDTEMAGTNDNTACESTIAGKSSNNPYEKVQRVEDENDDAERKTRSLSDTFTRYS